MKIVVFLHGTIIMHINGINKSRYERVKQVINKDPSISSFSDYVPIGKAHEKLFTWINQGVKIYYLSSHFRLKDVQKDKSVLKQHNFPKGEIFYRTNNIGYGAIIEKILPDILIEDDCESIGGKKEWVITDVNQETKIKIKSIIVKEFGGIDHLPNNLLELYNYGN